MDSTDYLDGLNTEQRKAVLATDGPVLIVAGAGAGRTKTLAHRILHLIKTGVDRKIFWLSHLPTKRRGEMRERVMGLIQQEKISPRVP